MQRSATEIWFNLNTVPSEVLLFLFWSLVELSADHCLSHAHVHNGYLLSSFGFPGPTSMNQVFFSLFVCGTKAYQFARIYVNFHSCKTDICYQQDFKSCAQKMAHYQPSSVSTFTAG